MEIIGGEVLMKSHEKKESRRQTAPRLKAEEKKGGAKRTERRIIANQR